MEKYERLLGAGGCRGAAREARLRHPALRAGGERRGRAALPLAGRAAGPSATRSRCSPPGPSTTSSGRTTTRAGTAVVNGIPVHRSTVRRHAERPRLRLALATSCFHETHTREEEEAWVRENGPFSPELVEAVAAARGRFDLFLFYCYRYYHSYHGLPAVRDRAILVPTAEEDPAIDLGIFQPFFRAPRGIVYLTPEEQALVEDASGNRRGAERRDRQRPRTCPSRTPPSTSGRSTASTRPFVLYVGRIDRNKGAVDALRLLPEVPRGERGGRGPRAGGQAGGADPRPPAHPPRRASSPRRRRSRRCGSAGSS